VPETETLEFAS